MNFSRLTVLHINIIGIVTAVILGVILFFVLIKPKQDDIAKTEAETASVESQGGTNEKVAASKKDLEKEKVKTKDINTQWAVDEKYYMPELHFGNDLLTLYEFNGYKNRGFKDLPNSWGTWITNWYDAQRPQGISRTEKTVFAIPAFPADPNEIASTTFLAFPKPGAPWKVEVECRTFDDAMNHLRRFNKMQGRGVPVVNNVTLSGQSPHLLLDYDLALYIIPSLPNGLPPKDPRIGAGGGGGGGTSGPGGGGSGGAPLGLPSMGGK